MVGKPAAPGQLAAPGKPAPLLPLSPPLTGLHLAELSATTGHGTAEVLDGDAHTGWRPSGQPVGARLRFVLDDPVTADELALDPCPASAPAGYDVEVNGSLVGELLTQGEPVRLSLGEAGAGWRVAGVEVRVRSGQPGVCLGELGLRQRGGALPLRPPRTVKGSVRASSVLPPSEAHHPNLLFDHRLNFGWTEGKAGDGIGESVEISLKDPFGLVGLELWNGDQGSSQRYASSPRVRTLSVGVDDGGRVSIPVEDTDGPQRLDLPRMVVGRTFHIGVLEVEPGATNHELTLSELRLVDLLGWVGVVLDDEDARRASTLPPVRDATLAGLVDQPLRSICGGRTLTLRADFGFETEAVQPGAGLLRAEGDWTLGDSKAPWRSVLLRGEERVRPEGWLEPEDQVAGKALDDHVEFVRIEDLGRAAFEKEESSWRSVNRALADCVDATAKAEGIDAFDLSVKRDAVLIHGALGPDVLTR